MEFKSRPTASKHNLICIALVFIHITLFLFTTNLPSNEFVSAGRYQRDMAGWYVPMAQGNFNAVPEFARTRWLTPVLASVLPLSIRNSFLMVNCFFLILAAIVLLQSLKKLPPLFMYAGILVFLWSYIFRYTIYNPFVPDGIRYLCACLILLSLVHGNLLAMGLAFALGALNHESVLTLMPLVIFLPVFKRPIQYFRLFSVIILPAMILFYLNQMIMKNSCASHYCGLFSMANITNMIDVQGGLNTIANKIYSNFNAMGLLFFAVIRKVPGRLGVAALLWISITFLQLLTASDTQRLIGMLIPVIIFTLFWGINNIAGSKGWFPKTIVCWVVIMQIVKSISRFDTRSLLSHPILYNIPYDFIDLASLLITVPLIIMLLKRCSTTACPLKMNQPASTE